MDSDDYSEAPLSHESHVSDNECDSDTEETFTFFHSGPFSQWYASPFTAEGISFSCAEQYMMYHKAILFNDSKTAKRILATSSPAEHKKLGRSVRGFKERIWKKYRIQIVYEGSMCKFSQNEKLKQRLLETKGTTLVEASPSDTIWGIGLREGDTRCLSRSTWRGENLLGEILTRVRENLIDS